MARGQANHLNPICLKAQVVRSSGGGVCIYLTVFRAPALRSSARHPQEGVHCCLLTAPCDKLFSAEAAGLVHLAGLQRPWVTRGGRGGPSQLLRAGFLPVPTRSPEQVLSLAWEHLTRLGPGPIRPTKGAAGEHGAPSKDGSLRSRQGKCRSLPSTIANMSPGGITAQSSDPA